MRWRHRFWFAAVSLLPIGGHAEDAPSPASVALIAQNCFTCHGPEGHSITNMPTLHNLNADEITSRLKDFKSGVRASTVMGRHAKAYSDAEIDALAKYISGLNKQKN